MRITARSRDRAQHGVELGQVDPDRVAGRPGLDAIRAQQPPEPGDMYLQGLWGGVRRVLLPEGVDQAVTRDGLIRMEQENREQRTLLAAAQRERPTINAHLDGTKDSEFHAAQQSTAAR